MELSRAVDNLCLYDPQFEPAAYRFLSEVGGSSAIQPLTNWQDLVAASRNHTLVKFLVLHTHGLPGTVDLAEDRVRGYDFSFLEARPQFLRRDARILFLGCNIAEGSVGDRFMDQVGQYLLLGKGGFVGATTVKNGVFQIAHFASETYMKPLTGGRLKVKQYDMSGAPVGSRTVDRHGVVR
jgi:hypothetical protein